MRMRGRETEIDRERRRRARETQRHRRETRFTVQKRRRPLSTRGYCMLMYAEAGGVNSVTFPVLNNPPLVFQYYYAGTVNAHTRVSRRPRDPRV